MFSVENKFEIGEDCFTLYRRPIMHKCPICEEKGKFLYNGYEIYCKNCNGTGKLRNLKQYVLDTCKVKIRAVKVLKNFEGSVSVKYVVIPDSYGINVRNRGEDNLFKTIEEAESYSMAVNQGELIPEF